MNDLRDLIRRFIVVLLGLVVSVTTSILVLMKGWGMEPRSWSWILVGTFAGHFLAQILVELGKEKPKK